VSLAADGFDGKYIGTTLFSKELNAALGDASKDASTIDDLSTQPSATSAQSRWSAGRLNPPSTEAGKITIQSFD
jgi:hypothetical protein